MDIGIAKEFIRDQVTEGRLRYSRHIRERMEERNVIMADLLNVLCGGEVSAPTWDEAYGNWTCRVKGIDLDEEELTVVVALDDVQKMIVCITVC